MKIPNAKLFIIALILVGGALFLLAPGQTPGTQTNTTLTNTIPVSMSEKDTLYSRAPELAGIAGYINAPEGFTLQSLKGKVVIVDFWTYSCINCIRTQPYLNAWYDAYADKGLVIVGVHTPEFDFEKEYDNVKKAVEKEKIRYPVVLDNDYTTWRAYKNQYWPRKYLIDADGYIRYDHIGEGGYDETEMQLQALLKERDDKLLLNETVSNAVTASTPATDFSQIRTPEIYLGYAFARAPLANPEGFQPESEIEYALPETLPPNVVALEGTWVAHSDYMELVSEYGRAVLSYSAKNANIVASGNAEIVVVIDGQTITTFTTSDEKLYPAIEGNTYGSHTLTLDIKGKGFKLYTFTFG